MAFSAAGIIRCLGEKFNSAVTNDRPPVHTSLITASPRPYEFCCVVSVSARFMPTKFSKLRDVLVGYCGPSLDISLEHDPKVIRMPA